MIRLQRHALGPRCYVLGRRLHEWHVGLAFLLGAMGSGIADHRRWSSALALTGAWLVGKDYNDLFPSRRNQTAWSLGVHRRPLSLRTRKRGASLPVVFAGLTAAVGAVNIGAAVRPGHGQSEFVLAGHAFLMPAGIALIALATYLARRRRRAWWLSVGVLAVTSVLAVVRGPDIADAAVTGSLLAALIWGRSAFTVRHTPGSFVTATMRTLAAFAIAIVSTTLCVVAAQRWTTPDPTTTLIAREVGALLTFSPGPLHFGEPFAWLSLAAITSVVAAILCSAWELFRPLRSGHRPVTAHARELVRKHGADTLSAFKLRPDLSTFTARDGRAFVSYRVRNGVLLIAGDPVGPSDALRPLVRELCAFAEERGLRIGAVGASPAFAELGRDAGLGALYLGDEAVVSTAAFTLDGRRIKKVRQAVNRVIREGYTAELRAIEDLAPAELSELEAVSARWRAGAPERGFSMAMDGLRGEHLGGSVVVIARDHDGHARGFLHFVPAYGAPVMSLSAMRRDRDTPNGVTEFLIVTAIEEMRERGIEELSLNFAAFARWLHNPANRVERVLGRVVRWANPYFQIESLYTFNAKFFPRWAPRYLLHDGATSLPRTALAALWAEGQIPDPAIVMRRSRLVSLRAEPRRHGPVGS